jgi:hydroxymethylbilane synthase
VKARSTLSFGTLATPLAKAQTQVIVSRLQRSHPRLNCQVNIIPNPPTSKRQASEPYLATSAAQVEYLEEQLLAEEFRLIVQRAADLVLPLREGLTYAAVPERSTPYDALLNRQGLIADDLPDGAKIGVLNLRTKSQMLALYPRLNVQILAGGTEAALEALLRRCVVDALIMPAAVTEHMGIQGIVTEIFYPEVMLPSSGQGILIVLARTDDKEAIDLLQALHSEATFLEMEAEHAFMQRFASDQDLPISALAKVERRRIRLEGAIGSLHGTTINRDSLEGAATEAAQIGRELAERLLMSGEAVIDLLEADFPEGLSDLDLDDPLAEDLSDELELDLESELSDELPATEFREDPPETT